MESGPVDYIASRLSLLPMWRQMVGISSIVAYCAGCVSWVCSWYIGIADGLSYSLLVIIGASGGMLLAGWQAKDTWNRSRGTWRKLKSMREKKG